MYKHADYMKECGIELEVIARTMRLLTVLQEITLALEREKMRVAGNGQSDRSGEIPVEYGGEFMQKFK